MPLKLAVPVACALAALGVAVGGPALADVKAGVDAWSRGDYMAAVKQWQGPAEAGDPDAMFNLAQAYRLGRGVAVDAARAEQLYARAAAAGHVQAADTYGLLLFQSGRREAALPYLRDAARRGDPRSEYLIGLAHFNGDLLPKDWVRAYALVTLANADGLPQAAEALAEMDQHIPLAQRQQAAALAPQLRAEADAARNAQLAAFDLATLQPRTAPGGAVADSPAPRPARAPVTVARSPSIAAALEAIEEASRATGTESPAEAGARFARPRAQPRTQIASAAAAPRPPAVPAGPAVASAPRAAVAKPAARAESAAAPNGPWRVQLGAFSVAANAQRLWQDVGGRAELAGKQRLLVNAGGVTRLQAGGFASRDAAEATCRALARARIACLVPPL